MGSDRKTDGARLELGLVSLPVMACVLAATLLTTKKEPPPARVDPADEATLTQLESTLPEVRQRLNQVSARILDSAAKASDGSEMNSRLMRIELELLRLGKERDSLEASVTEDQERASLREKIEGKMVEIAGLTNALARVATRKNSVVNRLELAGMEEFPRPYVSIDCKKGEAAVYPPKMEPRTMHPPLAKDASLAMPDHKWLHARIVEAKAVVVFGRTASFDSTYAKIFNAVVQIQKDEKAKNNSDIAVSFVPVQDHEDISGHILRGGG